MNLSSLYQESVSKLKSAGCSSPELDGRIILEFGLKLDQKDLILKGDLAVSQQNLAKIRRLINRRKKGEPIAYITGHKEFFGLDFLVNKNVLIPRPETEHLLEEAIKIVKNKELNITRKKLSTPSSKHLTILDMGTGSGCMIIYLGKKLSSLIRDSRFEIRLYASDISKKALAVAKRNAKRLLFEDEGRELEKCDSSHLRSNNIRFLHSDLFSNRLLHKKFHLIVANLPYVPFERKLNPKSTIKYEPKKAIFAGDNGSEIIKKFISQSKDYLAGSGMVLLELDPRNTQEIAKFARKIYPDAIIKVSKDLAKRERYLKIERKN